MSSIKKLAGQTLWYGASSILAKFLIYMLTPYLTLKFRGTPEYGKMSLIYALVSFLNIMVLFGLDTTYFRYIQKKGAEKDLYDTIFGTLLTTTTLITIGMFLFRHPLAAFIDVANHPEYIILCALIIGFDALSAIPFARLRYENKPKRFAVIRVSGVLLNIAITYFFLSVCPRVIKAHPNSVLQFIYRPNFGFLGYLLLANAIQNLFQLAALSRQLREFRWTFNVKLWREIMVYALPLTIAGFGGMINEVFDRIMLDRRLPHTGDYATYQVGIYSACYKLSLLVTLFVQAFRMGAEPFFFRQSLEQDAPRTYARVMKFFVITVCLLFLFVALYLDIWKSFITDHSMWQGLKVVPILLFANIFLGIYYNLSIWYRLTQRTIAGAYITLIGAALTLVINYIFIPRYSYMASAWATFICYGSMMTISFIWGQKAYRVPYAWKKLVAYMVIVALIYFFHLILTGLWQNRLFSLGLAALLTGGYALLIGRIERKEFQRLPYIGRFLGNPAPKPVT